MTLDEYGWNDKWAARFEKAGHSGAFPARVLAEHRGSYRVHNGSSEFPARISGRLRHAAGSTAEFPAVGDWVAFEQGDADGEALIHAVLPRESKFSRKAAGARTDEQVVAANVDTVWIVSAFGTDLNPARIDRYLSLVWESGAAPAVVLTKADLEEEPDRVAADLEQRVIGVPIHAVSALDGTGLDQLEGTLLPGRTIAMLGSSGVGKSTLLNRIAGREIMEVAPIRVRDGRGRHKTTHRQLVLLPSGGLLLDTPGMRELQLWSSGEGIEQNFADIESIAGGCRYTDCRHESEPGCAVHAAIEQGELDAGRLASFHKLRKELAYFERKLDVRAELEEKQRWKEITMEWRRFKGKN